MPFALPLRAMANAAVALSIIFVLLAQSALGQDGGKGGRDEARPFDAISFQGRDEFEISDPAQVPQQVARAAEQGGCHYIEQIADQPLRFLKIDSHRLVLVFCSGIVGEHQVFDLRDMRRPKRFEFAVMSTETGFGHDVFARIHHLEQRTWPIRSAERDGCLSQSANPPYLPTSPHGARLCAHPY